MYYTFVLPFSRRNKDEYSPKTLLESQIQTFRGVSVGLKSKKTYPVGINILRYFGHRKCLGYYRNERLNLQIWWKPAEIATSRVHIFISKMHKYTKFWKPLETCSEDQDRCLCHGLDLATTVFLIPQNFLSKFVNWSTVFNSNNAKHRPTELFKIIGFSTGTPLFCGSN